VLHFFRLLFQWTIQVGSLEVPFWISWGGLVGAALLSVWGFASAKKASESIQAHLP
jgi:hypothetical protein